MDGCGCDGYASPVDARTAKGDRERYRRRGPDPTTRRLLHMILPGVVPGDTLLDVGGGIGVIGHELLKAGASRATIVEATPEYIEEARSAAADAGLADRIEVVAGDFVVHAEEVEAADIVTLDRVVCCYADAAGLVAASAGRCRRLYGLVLPRDRWYVPLIIRIENLFWRLRRRAYRGHAHSNKRIDAWAAEQGLRPRVEAFTALWRVVLYSREPPASGPSRA